MKKLATLKNVESIKNKNIIIRNLSRIMDIRIMDIDMDNGIICFIYENPKTFEQVKKELSRIGLPIQNYTIKHLNQLHTTKRGNTTISFVKSRSSQPYVHINQLREK
ncbi:hypothetical protein ACOCEA_14000 [Maribacter sp. CXY002]|uniref:hypothetical protein n=1 Tax=Maribacter luteocoastalis TaxID=3407671 RepID=UPI003B66F526